MKSSYFFKNIIPTYRKAACLPFFAALFFIQLTKAQIYNYDPVRHTSFETNPAYLAASNGKYMISLQHHAALFSGPGFYTSSARFSAYSQKCFTGIGLALSHAKVNDSTRYSCAGAGAGYRTILFNKVFTRIGVLYNITTLQAAPGKFLYYSFLPDSSDVVIAQRIVHNASFSVSFSSPGDKYYISGGVLNYSLPWQQQSAGKFFPQYFVVNVGDFGKIFTDRVMEIYYTAFAKKYTGEKTLPLSHYIVAIARLNITRSSLARYGARIGAADNEYLHFSPMFSFFKRLENKRSINFQLMTDIGHNVKTNKKAFDPAIQLGVTYMY